MPRAVFGVDAPWEPASWGHARAFAGGQAEALASLRRGLTLRAEATLSGEATAALRFLAMGGLAVGVDAGAQIGLQAAVPLDLFGNFGLVARVEASARAAAWARAELGLSAEMLADLLRTRLDGAPLELALAVLRELEVRAGFATRAAASAEAYARLVVAGSLLETKNGPPGFNVVADAGYGLKAGTGYTFAASFGIHDPHRLAVSAASVIEREVYAELERAAAREPLVRDALPLARLIVPAALPAAYAAGKALAESDLTRRRKALGEVTMELARALARSLTAAATDWALQRAKALVSGIVQRLPVQDAIRADAAAAALTAIPSPPPREIFERLWTIVEIADRHAIATDPLPEAIAIGWAASALAEVHNGQPFAQPPAGIAARTGTTPAHAVAYLLSKIVNLPDRDRTAEIIAAILRAADPANRQRLIELALRLGSPAVDDAALDAVAAAMAPLVERELVRALQIASRSASPAAAAFLTETAVPAVRVLATLLEELPAIRTAGDDAAAILRERLSIGLIGALGRCIVTLADALQEHALVTGARSARELAAKIRRDGGDAFVDGLLEVWRRAPLRLILPDAQFVADLLELAAEVAERWSSHTRREQTALLQALITEITALADPAMRQILADASHCPGEQTLHALIQKSAEGIAGLAQLMTQRLPPIFAAYAARAGGPLASGGQNLIDKGMKVVRDLVTHGENVRRVVDRLREDVDAALASLERELATLSGEIESLRDRAVTDVRDWIWTNTVAPALAAIDSGASHHLRGAYDGVFAAAGGVPDAALRVVREGKDWVRSIVDAQIERRSIDGPSLLAELRRKAAGITGPAITFSVGADVPFIGRIGAGPFTIGADAVAQFLADQIAGILSADGLLGRLLGFAQSVVDLTARRNEAMQAAANATTITSADLAALTTGRTPVIRVTPHEPSAREAAVSIEVQNINASFLEPFADVPPRVQVLLGEEMLNLPRAAWSNSGSTFRIRLSLQPQQNTMRAATTVRQRLRFSPLASQPIAPPLRLEIGNPRVVQPAPRPVAVNVIETAILDNAMTVRTTEASGVPLTVNAGEHLLTVTAADGTGRSRSASCFVIVPEWRP